MRLLGSALTITTLCSGAAVFSYHIVGDDPGTWPTVLSSIGLRSGVATGAGVVVIPAGAQAPVAEWTARIERGTIVILEGESPLAASLGFKPTAQRETIRSVEDLRAPQLKI